jgi:antitoxin (DNA-binding transcriptional repressor) of toxin-antitoxin stability system
MGDLAAPRHPPPRQRSGCARHGRCHAQRMQSMEVNLPARYNNSTIQGELMVEITIEEIAKDPISYLHRTQVGESFVVLQAGQPIAQINPILPSATPDTVDASEDEETPLMHLFLDFAVSEALKNRTLQPYTTEMSELAHELIAGVELED